MRKLIEIKPLKEPKQLQTGEQLILKICGRRPWICPQSVYSEYVTHYAKFKENRKIKYKVF